MSQLVKVMIAEAVALECEAARIGGELAAAQLADAKAESARLALVEPRERAAADIREAAAMVAAALGRVTSDQPGPRSAGGMNRADLVREIKAEAIILEADGRLIEAQLLASKIEPDQIAAGKRAMVKPRLDAAEALHRAAAAVRAIPAMRIDR